MYYQPKAVIFDMDGLMFDSECVWKTLWEPALAAFGREVPEGLPEAACGTTGDFAIAAIERFCGPEVDARAVFTRVLPAGRAALRPGCAQEARLGRAARLPA